ncbi:YetF domain-containing protein [Planococcus halotolerans]|uniref:YetF C-terminal domain-containing protein n=1 Tax=Planococcus halotolerans TaxID=2233542 RepID=A0A365KV10_9BACL|nr:YetF domain-containing protein [Planococcus halotolerans]QHJ71343.1 hypothetical protein DNR44_012220 [Planococcus halotolerans]RAZ76801.1 hypothetical protein DP120_12295 [Planococcus halotolerans]
MTPERLDLNAEEEELTYLFVDKGRLNKRMLDRLGKSKEWLENKLQKRGYPALKNLVYVDWSPDQGFQVRTRQDGTINLDRMNYKWLCQ